MDDNQLDAEKLRQILFYDEKTGIFIWKITKSNRAPSGTVAGRDNGNGYIRININRRSFYAHRLAWLHYYGYWPRNEVDHIDGNRKNNAISNLREATHAENGQNQPLRKTNTAGAHNVSWHKETCKWNSYIWVNGKKKSLGLFLNKKDAADAYLLEKSKLHYFQPVPRDLK